MTQIIADISVSLDGSFTRLDPSPDNGLGTGGEALHTWAFSDDRLVLREGAARSGAVVLGRGLFEAAPRAGRRNTTVHQRGAAHAGAAKCDLDINRDAPDLRRLAVIR